MAHQPSHVVEELAANPRLVAYVLGDPTAQAEWAQWLRAHPSQAAAFDEAVALIRSLHSTQARLSDATIDKLWQALDKEMF